MDDDTFTSNDLTHEGNGAIPAQGTLDTHMGGEAPPPYRANEIPRTEDSIFLVENVYYESSENIGKVEDTATTYGILPE